MLLRKLVVVGLVGFISFAANIATAEDAVGPSAAFVDGVNFADPSTAFSSRFQLNLRPGREGRFSDLTSQEPSARRGDRETRGYEVSVVASSGGFDVAFAQRGGVGFNNNGDVNRQTRGSELRLGHGLPSMPRDAPSRQGSWYLFAASEDEALIWRPGVRSDFGDSRSGFALQDRVEIGDVQAGITYEANGWQASLAYVEREESTQVGTQSFEQDMSFTGVTITMRH